MKKKLLAAMLAVCMVASMLFVPAAAADEGTFPDVAEDHWASEAIERWAGYGVLTGHEDGTFAPESNMQREQFASMMVKLLGLTKTSGKTFADVTGSYAWAEPDVDKVATAGIVQGYSDGSFGAGRAVSFESAAVMMSRALGLVTIEESSGTDWADVTVEKLDDLGMLDENVNADADANRALVAALANNMIGTYVTPDTVGDVTEDGVLTGEFTGVILVVGDVEVNIENATVSAPIVVQSANVTLTGTTAANVKVGGENASITADEDSTVANVTVGGESAKVELNGEVTGTVTVAADAAGEIEIVAPVEVANESPVDVTVNGETVEGKPVEEDPDDTEEPEEPENPDDESGSGFVPEPSAPATNPEQEEAPEKNSGTANAPSTGTITAETTTSKDEDGNDVTTTTPLCTGEHKWGAASVTQAATCTTDGVATYTCSECHATSTVKIPAVGHNWYRKTVAGATCESTGSVTWACANGDDCVKPGTNNNVETIAALGHQLANKDGGIVCTRDTDAGGCGNDGTAADKWIVAPPAAPDAGDDEGEEEEGGEQGGGNQGGGGNVDQGGGDEDEDEDV